MVKLLSRNRLGQFFAVNHFQSLRRGAQFIALGFGLFATQGMHAQTITITINQPGASQIVHDPLPIRVTTTSTFELQGVQALIAGLTHLKFL